MKEWEKELVIYRLTPAPPKENDLQKYILNYFAQKEDKYISWFLHYYERTLNEKAMAIVQDYAMYGHFLDIKQAYVIVADNRHNCSGKNSEHHQGCIEFLAVNCAPVSNVIRNKNQKSENSRHRDMQCNRTDLQFTVCFK